MSFYPFSGDANRASFFAKRSIVTMALCSTTILSIITIQALLRLSCGHQSIAYPWPISRDGACRMGVYRKCPGPCPKRDLRQDQTPDSSTLTVSRGQNLTIHIRRNNHAGGFSRWSLVHVKDMYNKREHADKAFLYSCGDLAPSKCESWNWRRDCSYDRSNLFYKHIVTIPEIYEDGVYVLGWAWYGGTQAHGRGGAFGDYYDCMYVRVRGGAFKQYHIPVFQTGPSKHAKRGRCAARTNVLGDCWKEPCHHRRQSRQMVPWEFSKGRKPLAISRNLFNTPYQSHPVPSTAPHVIGISIREADPPNRILASSGFTSTANLSLRIQNRLTLFCDVTGSVDHVSFFRNGAKVWTASSPPYSVQGGYGTSRKGQKDITYKAWLFQTRSDMYSLACLVRGTDGSEQWATIEVKQLW
ncbi:hypothetical protein BWQ96_08692 [Gracilariopsis chorda]|uniref:Uncharacterized protein n=1 Tax=Gracilariopsis chorda TaxID=448386 RepID=A0A2V3IHR4_9FLOR|nr:hypothetical protein BWQ96_08692 [Gracilariopsis chorda]|eukprot:PXF41578.1 hypothetical protein BWQ96_08692 [Gracilariopsis chorda]